MLSTLTTRSARRIAPLLAALAFAGCDDGGGVDAGPIDAGRPDAGFDAGVYDAGGCVATTIPDLAYEELVPGHQFVAPVGLYQAPGDPSAFFVIEQPGRILVVRDGRVLDEPFIDIVDRVTLIGERGLLGMAFHPDYETNGRVFLYYADGDPPHDDPAYNVLAEYHVSASDPYRLDREEVARLIEETPERGNHMGGNFVFGPDGMLWGGMGDGAGWDPINDAQDLSTPFGAILRVDVDAPERDYVPTDNPPLMGFPIIWAYGLRNPWRLSFDRLTGDFWVGDVGETLYEEINMVPAGSPGGMNFGWPAYEGDQQNRADHLSYVPEHAEPLYTIRRDGSDPYTRTNCSVIGGFVYRGVRLRGLEGYYVYTDHCSPDVAAFRMCDGAITGHQRIESLALPNFGVSSFAEDLAGELYVIHVLNGTIHKIVAP